MELPYHILDIIQETANLENEAAFRKVKWAVVLGLTPYLDGDLYCLRWGKDIHSGVVAFGKTPEEAINNFEEQMRTTSVKKGDTHADGN